MSEPTVIIPTISLSGTHHEELTRQLLEFRVQLHAAIEACTQCAPNGRDYFREPGHMKAACMQHDRWRNQLEQMAVEVLDVVDGIQQQVSDEQ